MRIARKLTLLAMLALAATAMAAPSAFAQTEPLTHNQTPRIIVAQEVHAADDAPCPAVNPSPAPNPGPISTNGGCRLHFTSTGQVPLTAHLSAGGTEVVVSSCAVEFDVRLDSAGEGYLTHHEFIGPNPPRTRRACGQTNPPTSEGRAWSAYLRETEVAGQGPREEIVALFCTEPIGAAGPAHCEVTVPLTQTSTHRYQFVMNDVSGHGAIFPHCEVSGTFNAEAVLGNTGEDQQEQNIEIRHT